MSDAITGTPTNTAASTTPTDQSNPNPQNIVLSDGRDPVTGKFLPKDKAQATPGATPQGAQDKASAISDAAKEVMKKYKVKVDGRDEEVEEAELIRGYTHQKAANKKLQEGLAARKQAEQFLSMMKDPTKAWEVIQKLGHDPRKLSEEYLARQIKRELADPRDVELEDLKAKLAHIDDMDRQQKELEKSRHDEAMKKKYAQEYSDQFVEVLKTSGLPPTKEMVGRMAFYIQRAAKLGYQINPTEASHLVKEDIQKLVTSVAGGADGEMLLKLLGDEVASKILTARGAIVKDPNADLKTPQEQLRERRDPSQRSNMSQRDWRRFNRGLPLSKG